MSKQSPNSIALERIKSGEFEYVYESTGNKLLRDMNVLERQKANEARQRNRENDAKSRADLRKMLAELYELSDHKNEPKLWDMAWEYGHSNGFSEVALKYDDFASLMK
jgi:hypothetical protein